MGSGRASSPRCTGTASIGNLQKTKRALGLKPEGAFSSVCAGAGIGPRQIFTV
jgi:hypothetical protein